MRLGDACASNDSQTILLEAQRWKGRDLLFEKQDAAWNGSRPYQRLHVFTLGSTHGSSAPNVVRARSALESSMHPSTRRWLSWRIRYQNKRFVAAVVRPRNVCVSYFRTSQSSIIGTAFQVAIRGGGAGGVRGEDS